VRFMFLLGGVRTHEILALNAQNWYNYVAS
jgi:hypothetical protein